ncbi:N-acetyltransferase family protein [Virgibacillus sp. C22-A2]|uniref:N-acetyltransferase family protein n=1 Tax=Virgibacillus tibetensis TaxID=3042313 RepID=A0ABU6KK53_9BACI|nr:N-acetyltransferase family protein [Virgibacillus sp. C22-A2]
MNDSIVIDSMREVDWPEVRDIYLEGIAAGNATFATEAPDWHEWNEKYITVCRIVAREEGKVIGWAALIPTSSKAAYSGVAELSIYLSAGSIGKGIGTRLLKALINNSEANGFWTLQSGVFPENTASIKLHKKEGFCEVGVRKRIGKLNGRWRDVVMLERRSEIVGID